mmetsp:Transcript_13258/g.31421  ORF Transcript_13258/g.31421 Transcript_13258/m.31421 type:complete len:120 (-) Transcript_13258:69-428(-)
MLATQPARALAARASLFVRADVKIAKADGLADRLLTTMSYRSRTDVLPLPRHPFIRNRNAACSTSCRCRPFEGRDLYKLSGCRGSYLPVTAAGSLPMTSSLWNRVANGTLREPEFNPLL